MFVKNKERIKKFIVKTFINQCVKSSGNKIGAILPSTNNTVDVGILGYT